MKAFTSLLALVVLFSIGCTQKQNNETHTVMSFLNANIPHMDPIHSTNNFSSKANAAVFEGLYHYHYLRRPIEIEPLLAETMPEISKDKKTYTISIKKNILFQDDVAFANGVGREVTAQDFIYSWKRLADPKNKALGWWVFDGLIVGLNHWRDQMRTGKVNYQTPVEGLKAIDNHTLKITLTRPSFQFVHYLAMTVTAVVAREVVGKYGPEITSHPVGTGPFILQEWTRNSRLVFIKNPKYHPQFYPTDMKGNSASADLLSLRGQALPLAEKIIVKIIPERQPTWLSFLKGRLDHGVIPKDNYDQAMESGQLKKELSEKGIRILKQPRPDVTFVSFNMEHPVLGKNKSLRKALAAALNKEKMLEKFYNDRGVVAQSPIPPELDAYDPNYKHPISYDLDVARKHLVQAGFPEGKGLPVFDYDLHSTDPWARQLGEYLKDQWSKIGVKIKLRTNTWPQFDKRLKEKRTTLFDMAWMADYPDSQNFLQLYYSKNISPGPNSCNFISREYDDLYEKAVALPPGPKRDIMFRKLIDIINEEVPSIFIVHRSFQLPYHQWLKGYFEYPIIFDYYKYLSIDKDKKSQLQKLFN